MKKIISQKENYQVTNSNHMSGCVHLSGNKQQSHEWLRSFPDSILIAMKFFSLKLLLIFSRFISIKPDAISGSHKFEFLGKL